MVTSTVKNQLEALIYYSDTLATKVATVRYTDVGTADVTIYTNPEDSFAEAKTPTNIYAVLKTPIPYGDTDVSFQLDGEDALSSPVSGTFTIADGKPIGTAVKLNTSDTDFSTITGISSVAGGSRGVEVEILAIPPSDTGSYYTLLGFDEGFSFDLSDAFKAIPFKFDPANHYKRIRSEQTLSTSQLFTNYAEGLSAISGRSVLIKVSVNDDGQSQPSEILYFNDVRFTTSVEFGADGADGTKSGEGTYRTLIAIDPSA